MKSSAVLLLMLPSVDAVDNVLRDCKTLYFHFGFGLFLCVLGFVVLLSRIPRLKMLSYHPWMGSAWFYGILLQSATSLYCRKDGFKWFIMLFMIILVVNMSIGHFCIRIWQRYRPAEQSVDGLVPEAGSTDMTVEV